jgi:hypothetical protein
VVAALDTAEGRIITSQDPETKEARNRLEQTLAALPVDSQQAIEELAKLSRQYEVLRESMPPGQDRTYQMTLVLTRARALGRQAGLGTAEINRLLDGSDGDRIVGIAVAQGVPDKADVERLLEAALNSRSAFEQYAALEALLRAAPSMSATARNRVLTSLREELDRPRTFLQRGSDRYALAHAVLTSLTE